MLRASICRSVRIYKALLLLVLATCSASVANNVWHVLLGCDLGRLAEMDAGCESPFIGAGSEVDDHDYTVKVWMSGLRKHNPQIKRYILYIVTADVSAKRLGGIGWYVRYPHAWIICWQCLKAAWSCSGKLRPPRSVAFSTCVLLFVRHNHQIEVAWYQGVWVSLHRELENLQISFIHSMSVNSQFGLWIHQGVTLISRWHLFKQSLWMIKLSVYVEIIWESYGNPMESICLFFGIGPTVIRNQPYGVGGAAEHAVLSFWWDHFGLGLAQGWVLGQCKASLW